MARGKHSPVKAVVWAVPLLAILGFGGFGAVNFSGSLRSIGSVGDTDIGTAEYSRALQNEMRAFEAQTGQPMTVEQARQIGLADQVLSQVVTSAALDDEAGRMGLSVGDERVAEQLRTIQAFQGPDGKFSRDAYSFALKNAGLDPASFEADIRAESARSLLQGAVVAGTTLPDTYVNTLLAWAGQTRDFTWARVDRSQLDIGLPEPSEEELKSWYDDHIALFTLPEAKVITYAWLTPDMIVDTVEVDEDTLRKAYDERSDQYNVPERRLVERLVFANEAEAQAALDKVTSGETDFETLVTDRGLDLADADMGDVARDALGEAGDAVFAAETGDVVGPAPSPLGPALFRVNGVLAAQVTPFEEAEPALRDELALDRAQRVISGMAQSLEDELAGGATLEDIADETDMQLGTVDWTSDLNEGIAGYEAFNTAAKAVTEDDFPTIAELGDGGIFALRLDEIRPPAPQPFEEVRAAVVNGWEQDKATEQLSAQAETLLDPLRNGASFEDEGLSPVSETGLTRDATPEGVPTGMVAAAFGMSEGELRVLPGTGAALILRVDRVAPVDPEDENVKRLAGALREQAANSVAQDLYRALNADIQTRVGVHIDQQAVAAVQSSFR